MSRHEEQQRHDRDRGGGKSQRERQIESSEKKVRRVPDWLKIVMMGCWVIVNIFLFFFLTGWWELKIENGKVTKDIWDSTIPMAILCIGIFGALFQLMIFNYYEDR